MNSFETRGNGKPVAIVGMGVYTPLGGSVGDTVDAMLEGRHGLKPLPSELRYDDFDVHVAGYRTERSEEISEKTLGIDRRTYRWTSLPTHLAIYATRQAMEEAGIRKGNGIALADEIDSERVGYSIGSGASGANLFGEIQEILNTNDRVKDPKEKKNVKNDLIFSTLPERMGTVPMMLSGETDDDGPTGPVIPVLGACAAGNLALALATEMIRAGKADIMIAGGTEAQLNRNALTMFGNIEALDQTKDPDQASLPFGLNGNGFVMSEGAGVMVLEDYEHAKKRGANVLALITGTGMSGDGVPSSTTMMNPKGPAKAMREALREGGGWEKLWIKAHATGTKGDPRELQAIGQILQPHEIFAISSLKRYLGHTIGASGAIEAAIVVEAMRRNIVLSTASDYEMVDDAAKWPVIREHMSANRMTALLSSFGFGGINTCLRIDQA